MPYYFRLPPITDLTTGQQAALNETNAIAISGGPGTGKSVVSLWRHIRNHGLGYKNTLLLTYTKTLQAYLASSAMSENPNAGDTVDRTLWWTTHNARDYDEIIIDEAQDVEGSIYEQIQQYSELISYGADDQQIVYPSTSTTQQELVSMFPNNRHYVLDENFRNTYEIMHFVKALFPNKLVPQHTINLLRQNRRGNKPILLLSNHDFNKQTRAIIDIINQLNSGTHNIAILVPFKEDVVKYSYILSQAGINYTRYHNGDGELVAIENVHVTTFKSAKGTEFDTVILPDFHNMVNYIETKRVVKENDYYVALTRARRNLYLLSPTPLSFLQTSQQQISTYQTETIND